jgi:hypothetical protein
MPINLTNTNKKIYPHCHFLEGIEQDNSNCNVLFDFEIVSETEQIKGQKIEHKPIFYSLTKINFCPHNLKVYHVLLCAVLIISESRNPCVI